MKFVAISDTHGKHLELDLPEGDCLIHAGDVSSVGKEVAVMEFIDWFQSLDYQYKIFIAGNHDFFFENHPEKIPETFPNGVFYLNDSSIQLEGINIHGSPVQPYFFNWAFNRQRGEDIDKHWQLIPENTDILITHGPPYGKLDLTARQELVGCSDLMNRVNLVNPKVHIFGHIHEAYGELKTEKTHFINASVLNLNYRMVNEPIVFDFSPQSL